MKLLYIIIAIFFVDIFISCADTDRKSWNFKNGPTISAVLVKYVEESDLVILQKNDGSLLETPKQELSSIDQKWIESYLSLTQDTKMKVEKLGGKMISGETVGLFPTTYHLYRPSSYEKVSNDQPMLILFHPGGKGGRFLARHIEAAEKVGLSILALDVFQNTNNNQERENEFRERFSDVLVFIRAELHNPSSKLFLGGSSGGAWRAYHYSAWFDGPWDGIYANGGWLGGEKYANLNYPANMKIAIVNGHQDKAANHWVEYDKEILEKKGSFSKVFVFEGAHQVSPIETQIEAFEWLLKDIL